jgi:hypothetical protein
MRLGGRVRTVCNFREDAVFAGGPRLNRVVVGTHLARSVKEPAAGLGGFSFRFNSRQHPDIFDAC